MKIAFVYDVIYPYSIGGGEKLMWELSSRLAAKGHSVHMITSKMWEGPDSINKEGVEIKGVSLWNPVENNLGNRRWIHPFQFSFGVFNYFLKERFDLIYCRAFPYLPCFAIKVAGLFQPLKFLIAWDESRGLKAWINQAGPIIGTATAMLERITASLIDRNIAVSEYTAKRMVRFLGFRKENINVIPCGVDVPVFHPNKDIIKENTILYVGRVVRHKRVDLLVEAFSSISKEFESYSLKIIGSGSELKNLNKLIRDRKLEDRVTLLDSMPSAQLIKEFQKASVFVLPSEQEGFGMVMIEAMASGTPVIALDSSFSAASTLIKDNVNGMLFYSNNQLVGCLRKILRDPEFYSFLVQGGYSTAVEYDWNSSIIPKCESYFKNCL